MAEPAQEALPNSPKGIAAVIAACIAGMCCPGVPAVVALVLARQARRQIATGAYDGDTMVFAAQVLSWVNIVGCVVVALTVLAAKAWGP